MISEQQLAKGFQQLWGEILPLLSPHFVHVFNEAYRQPLKKADGRPATVVPIGNHTNPALVAEYAFHIVRLAHEDSVPLLDAAQDKEVLSHAGAKALASIREYESEGKAPETLNSGELAEALLLVNNYASFLSGRAEEVIEFSPHIPGAGFVDACSGDLSVSSTLFEVKTVNRNIAGKDIRQLLVYLALQAATGTRRWPDAGFLNPRRALFYEFSVDKVIPLMSGGRWTMEVFELMVEYFGRRDIQLDSAF